MGDATATTTATAASGGAAHNPHTKSNNPFMQIACNPDGTVTRPFFPTTPPSATGPVVSKDVPLDASLGTSLRLYLPNPVPPSPDKLPVILYFHGGGFVLFSADSTFYHASCEAMAAAVPALVVSLDYRLAPEHRLPAAYEDAVAALLWLRGAAATDPCLAAHGDLSRCFVMGSSSGGNMAFLAGIKIKNLDLLPVVVQGLILHQPYFGGVERTPSEARSEDDFMVPLEANDKLWRLALPEGADRDHEFANPTAALPPEAATGLPRCLVSGSTGDPLIDRQRVLARWLRERGVQVVERTDNAGFHAEELFVPEKADELFTAVREFVYGGDA